MLTLILLSALKWNLFFTPGERAISTADRLKAVAAVEDFYKTKVGIHIRLVSEAGVPYPVGVYTNNLVSLTTLDSWNYWRRRLTNQFHPMRVTTLIHPPIKDAGRYWSAGLANTRGIGTEEPFAIVWCKDDVLGCTLVLAHEIGHVLGARHMETANNYMHPAASQFLPEMNVHYFNKTQIRRRLKRVGLWQTALEE